MTLDKNRWYTVSSGMQLITANTATWHLPCRQPPAGQVPYLQVGARRCSSGRKRLQQQTTFGRRRAQEYEEEYEQEYEQRIAPAPEPVIEQRSPPLYVTIPGALLVLFALFKIVKRIQGRG